MRTLIIVSLMALAGCGAAGGKCEERTLGGPFCVPDAGVAPAGQKLSLEIVDQCTGSCGSAELSCRATRDGGTIALEIHGQVCEPPPGVACTLACALTRLKCEVPALEAGDYTVISPSQTSQALQVRDAGVASCVAPLF